MRALRRIVASYAFAVAVVAAAPAWAQGLADDLSGGSGGPPAWAYQIAHDLMSPFCPGRTLAACPSPQADQLRQWILFQAAAGQTQAEVEEQLFQRFGDVILSSPRAEGGWGISAYAIPIGGFLLGGPLVGFAIYRLARGQRGGGGGGGEAPAAPGPMQAGETRTVPDDELERLVEEEFARS